MARVRVPLVAAVFLAAMACAASSAHAACAGADLMPSAARTAKVRKATLCLLNVERGAQGLRKLRENGRLRRAATGYARFMVARRFFAHEGPDGSTMLSRIKGTRYLARARAWTIGENLAWGAGDRATPRAIVDAWMHSPGHRANILNPAFREIGIGIAKGAPEPVGGAPAATFATDFGARI
jgi:uncharacterized protein YkwD